MTTTLKINQPDDNAHAGEVIEQAIVDIAEGFRRLSATRLKREAIVLLIHDSSGVGKPSIRLVLDGLESLESAYLKPKIKK